MYHPGRAECFGAADADSSATEQPTPSATPPVRTPVPTPTPQAEPSTFQPGDPIAVNEGGRPWVTITVSEVEFVTSYVGGYLTDVPAAGNVYAQAWLRYEAHSDGVDYNPYDWQLFNDGVAVGSNFTILYNQPEPQLSSGTLPEGRVAEGWVVYEVPADGRLLMSYSGNVFMDEAPIFEVVLRD